MHMKLILQKAASNPASARTRRVCVLVYVSITGRSALLTLMGNLNHKGFTKLPLSPFAERLVTAITTTLFQITGLLGRNVGRRQEY
jgi:hypothetical protein